MLRRTSALLSSCELRPVHDHAFAALGAGGDIGWIGRQLSGLAQQRGLVDVTIHGTTPVFTDWALANQLFGLQRAAEQVVSAVEAAAWIRDLEQRAATTRFFSAITVFLVSGRKPLTTASGN